MLLLLLTRLANLHQALHQRTTTMAGNLPAHVIQALHNSLMEVSAWQQETPCQSACSM
jgi:hypothetical protein